METQEEKFKSFCKAGHLITKILEQACLIQRSGYIDKFFRTMKNVSFMPGSDSNFEICIDNKDRSKTSSVLLEKFSQAAEDLTKAYEKAWKGA